MVKAISSVLTEQDEDIREVNPTNAVLLRRLGLEAFPEHETMLVPTARLIVSGADHLARSAKRLVKSIQHVGILQNPSVVVQEGLDMYDEEATFEVIAGRRRVLAARLAGLSVVKCEVYAASTMPLSALLALIENEQRSAAWIREVEALRCLIDEGVGMTLDDLAAFGFDRATLAERLKIAQLPAPLLELRAGRWRQPGGCTQTRPAHAGATGARGEPFVSRRGYYTGAGERHPAGSDQYWPGACSRRACPGMACHFICSYTTGI